MFLTSFILTTIGFLVGMIVADNVWQASLTFLVYSGFLWIHPFKK